MKRKRQRQDGNRHRDVDEVDRTDDPRDLDGGMEEERLRLELQLRMLGV